ncbi:hypothetical protein SASC598P14_003480, partial [Snodgrassella alvi SCGC AB-598-P14]
MKKSKKADAFSPHNLYKRLFPYMRGLVKYFFISVLAMVVVGVTGPLFASLLKPIIDNGFVDKNIEA